MKTYVVVRCGYTVPGKAPLPRHVEEVLTDEIFQDFVCRISKEIDDLRKIDISVFEEESAFIGGAWNEIYIREPKWKAFLLQELGSDNRP